MRRTGYGVERPSVHPLRFTTSPRSWITFSILSAGFPTAAARWRGPAPPWPMNHTTPPGDDAQGALNGSRTPRQTAAHCGPIVLVSIVAARVRTSMAGEDVGLTGSGENHRADFRPAEGVVREDDRRSILHCQPLPHPSGHCRQPLPSAVQRYICLRCHGTVSYTHLRAHETVLDLVCRL